MFLVIFIPQSNTKNFIDLCISHTTHEPLNSTIRTINQIKCCLFPANKTINNKSFASLKTLFGYIAPESARNSTNFKNLY